jgi:hypothetical protein
MKSVKYLNDLAKMHNLENDNQVANFMGWRNGTVYNYKNGRRIMDNEACLAVALKLGIDPLPIIMAADIDRAERAGQHSLWEVFLQRMPTAASILFAAVVTLFLTPTPSEAAPVLKPVSATISIMSNTLRDQCARYGQQKCANYSCAGPKDPHRRWEL